MLSSRIANTNLSPLNVGFCAMVSLSDPGVGEVGAGLDPHPRPAIPASINRTVSRVVTEKALPQHFTPGATFRPQPGFPLQ
jgi:hypothetical protein